MPKRLAVVVTALVATTLLLAGCSGGSSSGKSAGGIAAGALSSAAAGPEYAADGTSAGGSAAQPAPGQPTDGTTSAPLKSTALILTADLTVQTKNVVQQAAGAVRIATAAGGSVTSEVVTDPSGSGATQHPPATADITLAVPPAALQSTLTQLDGLGTEQSRQLSSQDVTGQVADVTSRVASAQASITRLQTLFAQATKVSDIVDIESELSQREADLESLQAQERVLDAQTSDATITLHLVSTPVTTLARHHSTPRGFGTGLTHGWHAFAASVGWALTALGASLPFLIVVAVLGAAFVLFRRRSAAKPAPQPAAAAAGPSGPGISE